MKKLDCATVSVEEIQAIKGSYPTAKTVWKIATWYVPGRRWIIREWEWDTEEDVDKWAIAHLVQGYTHYCPIKIELPGAEL